MPPYLGATRTPLQDWDTHTHGQQHSGQAPTRSKAPGTRHCKRGDMHTWPAEERAGHTYQALDGLEHHHQGVVAGEGELDAGSRIRAVHDAAHLQAQSRYTFF